jgi:hypothetical protein
MISLMSRRCTIGVILTTAVLGLSAADCHAQARPNAAGSFQAMQATGKPAFIIAGSVNCPYCVELAEELQSNPAVRPLTAKLFVLKIDVATPDWPMLRRAFEFEENGIPACFFVRADGVLIDSVAGKPNDVPGYLQRQLDKAGTQLDDAKLKQMGRDAKPLDLALKRGDFTKAAELVARHAASGSYAALALQYDLAGERLVEEAKSRTTAATEQLDNEREPFAGALAIVEAQTQFAAYPPAGDLPRLAAEGRQAEPTQGPLLKDAEALLKARAAEQAKQWKAAVEHYTTAQGMLETEPARNYVSERLAELSKRVKPAAMR